MVLITSKQCILFSIPQVAEAGADAITIFPLTASRERVGNMSACIVGQLLVVCRTCPKLQFICCDLNKVLEFSKQNKEITSSIWRKMTIPDAIETAEWIDSIYLVQEKRIEILQFFPEGHPTHSEPRHYRYLPAHRLLEGYL